MRENESAAHELARRLVAEGLQARVEGGGVHWRIEVVQDARSVRVHCFENSPAGARVLKLGMNPANSRSSLGRTPAPREGLEYLVQLTEQGRAVADGRTRQQDEAVRAISSWLTGVPLVELSPVVPFIDQKPRKMRALAATLPDTLRWEIEPEPRCALWVYGHRRSCRFDSNGEAVDATFLYGQAQVGVVLSIRDVRAAVERWLLDGIEVTGLPAAVPGTELERHVEWIETQPARWHWLHLLDRVASPADVLAPLRPLVEALSREPVAATYFTYSSLNRLCFTASSHFPWSNAGLPVVAPAPGSRYQLGGATLDLDDAVARIEERLQASPVRPYFGSAADHELAGVQELLSHLGSRLRAQVIQRGAWFRLEVEAAGRRCHLDGTMAALEEGSKTLYTGWANREDAVRAAIRFVERGELLESFASAALVR